MVGGGGGTHFGKLGKTFGKKCFRYNVCKCGLGFNLEKHQPKDQDPDENVNFILSNGQMLEKMKTVVSIEVFSTVFRDNYYFTELL